MNGLDIALLLGLIVMVCWGYSIGLLAIITQVVGVLGGLVVAGAFFHLPVAAWETWFEPSILINIISFVLLFGIGGVLVSTVGVLLQSFLEIIRLSWLDHLAGGVVGLVFGIGLLGTGLLVVIHLFGEVPLLIESSRLAGWVLEGMLYGMDVIPWLFDDLLSRLPLS